jgi:hypothetical protein
MDDIDNFPETPAEAPATTAESAAEPAVVDALKTAEVAADAPIDDPSAEDEVLQRKVVRQRMSCFMQSGKRGGLKELDS